VAVQLDIPVLTFVSEVKIEEDGKILATRSVEGGYELLRVSAPVLISVVKEINEPWIPDYNGMMKAKSSSIKIMTAQDIGVDKTDCGLEGSPTRVSKVFYPKLTRNGEVFSDINPEKSAQKILDFLKVKNIL
jgi:electron transfer flavoprotein beta subunit